jgi:hypothetical protein
MALDVYANAPSRTIGMALEEVVAPHRAGDAEVLADGVRGPGGRDQQERAEAEGEGGGQREAAPVREAERDHGQRSRDQERDEHGGPHPEGGAPEHMRDDLAAQLCAPEQDHEDLVNDRGGDREQEPRAGVDALPLAVIEGRAGHEPRTREQGGQEQQMTKLAVPGVATRDVDAQRVRVAVGHGAQSTMRWWALGKTARQPGTSSSAGRP